MSPRRPGGRTPLRRGACAAVVATAALALSGCSGSVDGPVLTSARELVDRGGDAAEVAGRVELEGGCLLLVLDEPPDVPGHPVVWPAGTGWQPEPPAVVLPDGTVVPLGGRVSGGGGYVQADALPAGMGADVVEAAAACTGDTGEVAFFNPGSEVTVPGDR